MSTLPLSGAVWSRSTLFGILKSSLIRVYTFITEEQSDQKLQYPSKEQSD